jgi:hypothetical protein
MLIAEGFAIPVFLIAAVVFAALVILFVFLVRRRQRREAKAAEQVKLAEAVAGKKQQEEIGLWECLSSQLKVVFTSDEKLRVQVERQAREGENADASAKVDTSQHEKLILQLQSQGMTQEQILSIMKEKAERQFMCASRRVAWWIVGWSILLPLGALAIFIVRRMLVHGENPEEGWVRPVGEITLFLLIACPILSILGLFLQALFLPIAKKWFVPPVDKV